MSFKPFHVPDGIKFGQNFVLYKQMYEQYLGQGKDVNEKKTVDKGKGKVTESVKGSMSHLRHGVVTKKKLQSLNSHDETESVRSVKSTNSSTSRVTRSDAAQTRKKPAAPTGDENFLLKNGFEPQGFSWKPKTEAKIDIVNPVKDLSIVKNDESEGKVNSSVDNVSLVSIVKAPKVSWYEAVEEEQLEEAIEDQVIEVYLAQATAEMDNADLQVDEACSASPI